jgi:transposase
MGYTSDLSDKEWEMIEPLLLKKKKTRPPEWTKREILNGILRQAQQPYSTN